MCSINIVHIKIPYFSPPSSKWPWQSTSYNTYTRIFFPETNMFNSGILEIVASSPRNNNPKISDSFLIKLRFLSMFWYLITSKRSLYIRFLFWGWYLFDTVLYKSSTFLNLGLWDRLKERPLEIMGSDIAFVRRVSLEVIIFCVLFPLIKKIEPFWGVVGFLSGYVINLVLKDYVSDV